MSRNLRIALTLVTALILLLAVNLSASILFRTAKIDMTEEKLYSLSEGTINMLGKLQDDVRLKLFYSRRSASNIPQIKLYADRVIELLHQYVDRAGGGLPSKFSSPNPIPRLKSGRFAMAFSPWPYPRATRSISAWLS